MPTPLRLDACTRMARDQACNVDRCGLCEARAVSICNAIDDHHLDDLARAATALEFAPGAVFREEGQPYGHLFNIVSGTVKLFKLMPDGRRQVVGFLSTGDFLGLGSEDCAPCSAEALTVVRLCRFERGKFRALLDAHPELERRLLSAAWDEIAAGQEHMLLLGRMKAEERVARFLVSRGQASHRAGCSQVTFDLPMSRVDIADYLGLTTETVSRVFTKMRQSGWISYETARGVTLRDSRSLEAAAAGE